MPPLKLPVAGPCCGGPADKVHEYEQVEVEDREGRRERVWRKKRQNRNANS